MPRTSSPLRNLRRARTLNQTDMARLLNVKQQTYCKYELGKIVPPKDIQARIAAILGVAVHDCFPQVAA